MSMPNDSDTFGTSELCTWPIAPGVCRFQTTSPQFARKLSQRSGAKLVGWSVAGGYLRLFDEAIESWRAKQPVTRFLTPTNGAFSEFNDRPARRKSRRVSTQRTSIA